MNSDTLNKLSRLATEKKLIPFIGAGFSAPLGLPSWGILIKNLAASLDWDPEVFMQSGNFNYLELAEYYVLKKSIGELRNELSKGMIISQDKLKNSELHKALVDLDPKTIYTTNYDEGIEEAYKMYNKKHTVIRKLNDFRNADDSSTQIYKFHGDFIDDESLVLTESSYFERLVFENPLDIRLRSDILSNTLLFLGYSLSDINTRYIFYKLSKLTKDLKRGTDTLSAIMVSFGVSDIQKVILNNLNIEIIELDPIDRTKSLSDFLKDLKK